MLATAELREAVKKRLEAAPELAGVAILLEDRLDIEHEIGVALGTAGGLVCVVSTGAEKFRQSGNPVPVADIEVFVEFGEVPAVNRSASGSRLPASTAASIAVKALHHHQWRPGRVLVASEKLYDRHDKTKLQTYTCVFTTVVDYGAD